MMKTLRLFGLCAAMVLPGLAARAQDPAPAKNKLSGLGAKSALRPLPAKLPERAAVDVDFKIEVTAKYHELDETARFVVGSASQANHVAGGEKVYPVKNAQGTGVEFKKWGFIVNVLPVQNPNDPKKVAVQLQVELSGPIKSATSPSSDIPDISTWQYQSSFTLVKGRKTLIVESPARVEITIDDVSQ